jgi:hypothetical protein
MSPMIKGVLIGAVLVFGWQHLMGGTGKSKV